MKISDGKSQRREEKKKEDQKRESIRRKKIQVHEKVGKSRNTMFFQWFVAPEGRKVGSLKRRVRSPLGRWEMKNCTPLWRKKHTSLRPLLEVEMSKKCTPLWREAHFEANMRKAPHARTTFEGSDVVSRGRRTGLCTSSRVSKMWGFCSISKNDGRHGAFEEDLQRRIFRGRCSTRDMFIRAVRRSGRWFPERVAFWSIRSSGLLRWFCVTGTTLCMTSPHFFLAAQ